MDPIFGYPLIDLISSVLSCITRQEQPDSGISVEKLPESYLAIKEEAYRPYPNVS
jgi:hypothetical protein